jgi:hypothetical protein
MKLPNSPRSLILIVMLLLAFAVLAGMLTMHVILLSTPVLADTNTPGAAEAVQTFWGPLRYVNVPGSTLRPRASSTDWTYPGNGCISASGANDGFITHLGIPNGSRIDYLRIYYYDTSSNNSQAWVTTYNGAGGFADLTSVSSTGETGYGTQLSPFVNHIVDTAGSSYVLNWRSNQTGSTMRLCGLRVAYRMPLDKMAYLPMIIR